VLATLWPIEDHPGIAALMSAFYGALGRRGRGPAEALREARRAALAGGAPSSLAAAFAVVGG
jgi:CHAT domain-containing protein